MSQITAEPGKAPCPATVETRGSPCTEAGADSLPALGGRRRGCCSRRDGCGGNAGRGARSRHSRACPARTCCRAPAPEMPGSHRRAQHGSHRGSAPCGCWGGSGKAGAGGCPGVRCRAGRKRSPRPEPAEASSTSAPPGLALGLLRLLKHKRVGGRRPGKGARGTPPWPAASPRLWEPPRNRRSRGKMTPCPS